MKTVNQGDPGFDRQTSYTAIVEDIPPSLSNGAVLRAYMQELFKNDVIRSYCCCCLAGFVLFHQTQKKYSSYNNLLCNIFYPIDLFCKCGAGPWQHQNPAR